MIALLCYCDLFHQVRCVLPSASLMVCLAASARQAIFCYVNFSCIPPLTVEIDSKVPEPMVTAMCWNRFWRCNLISVTCFRRIQCQSSRPCLKDNLEIRKEINALIQELTFRTFVNRNTGRAAICPNGEERRIRAECGAYDDRGNQWLPLLPAPY